MVGYRRSVVWCWGSIVVGLDVVFCFWVDCWCGRFVLCCVFSVCVGGCGVLGFWWLGWWFGVWWDRWCCSWYGLFLVWCGYFWLGFWWWCCWFLLMWYGVWWCRSCRRRWYFIGYCYFVLGYRIVCFCWVLSGRYWGFFWRDWVRRRSVGFVV